MGSPSVLKAKALAALCLLAASIVYAGPGRTELVANPTAGIARAIALFRAGALCQSMRVLEKLAHTEDGSVFLADIALRVFDDRRRAKALLLPWIETSERAAARVAGLRGRLPAEASVLDCAACEYSDRTVDPAYFYLARAERGVDLEAKFDLVLTLLGRGPPILQLDESRLRKDYAKALRLFEELAEARHPRAMYLYAGFLLREPGVDADGLEAFPRDREKGLRLLKAAAELGEEEAAEVLRAHYGHAVDADG